MLTTRIYFKTLFAKPEDVEKPVEIFQSTRGRVTVVRGINPVVGKV